MSTVNADQIDESEILSRIQQLRSDFLSRAAHSERLANFSFLALCVIALVGCAVFALAHDILRADFPYDIEQTSNVVNGYLATDQKLLDEINNVVLSCREEITESIANYLIEHNGVGLSAATIPPDSPDHIPAFEVNEDGYFTSDFDLVIVDNATRFFTSALADNKTSSDSASSTQKKTSSSSINKVALYFRNSKAQVGTYIQTDLQTVRELSIQLRSFHWVCLELRDHHSVKNHPDLAGAPAPDFKKLHAIQVDINSQDAKYSKALGLIRQGAERSKIEDLSGPVVLQTDAITAFAKYEAFQATIIRVGIISCLFFLVAVFLSVYRYNIRLSAFYRAHSDAFGLVINRSDIHKISSLMDALTPKVSFEKSPSTPFGQLVDAVKSLKSER